LQVIGRAGPLGSQISGWDLQVEASSVQCALKKQAIDLCFTGQTITDLRQPVRDHDWFELDQSKWMSSPDYRKSPTQALTEKEPQDKLAQFG